MEFLAGAGGCLCGTSPFLSHEHAPWGPAASARYGFKPSCIINYRSVLSNRRGAVHVVRGSLFQDLEGRQKLSNRSQARAWLTGKAAGGGREKEEGRSLACACRFRGVTIPSVSDSRLEREAGEQVCEAGA